MKLFKTKYCIIIQKKSKYYPVNENWDAFVNDDYLLDKVEKISYENKPLKNGQDLINAGLEAPIGSQELWASGATYMSSQQGRQEETKKSGGGDFYQQVYEAERPELFFKANASRVVGHGERVRIRKDSICDIPEPELTLLITSNEKIVGYTIGNDMSSRSIESENPLYLAQAKTYDACAALGPCIYLSKEPLPSNTLIDLKIKRGGKVVFKGDVEINQIKRSLKEQVSFLYRECTFPNGSMLMTGTGIVPNSEFTLQSGDVISITIDNIGTLVNDVE